MYFIYFSKKLLFEHFFLYLERNSLPILRKNNCYEYNFTMPTLTS